MAPVVYAHSGSQWAAVLVLALTLVILPMEGASDTSSSCLGDLECEIRNDTSCNTVIHCTYTYDYLPDVSLDGKTLDSDCAVFDKHCELHQLIQREANLSAVIVLLNPQLLCCDKEHTVVIGWNTVPKVPNPCKNRTMAINIADCPSCQKPITVPTICPPPNGGSSSPLISLQTLFVLVLAFLASFL